MKGKDWALAAVAAVLMAGFALQPAAALESARDGLLLFFTVVLPSMLPFMVCACLFIDSGAAGAAGRLLDRVMRPLFACPGAAAFALAVSLLSGYPTGARVTAELVEAGVVSRRDALRTGVLASSTGPVFLLGAVGAGMLGSVAAGWVVLLSHYGAVLLTGMLFSLGGDRSPSASFRPAGPADVPLMESLGSATKKTVDTLWTVGGYIILFSVVVRLLRQAGALQALAAGLGALGHLVGLDRALGEAFAVGLLEMSNACSAAAQTGASLADRCVVLAMAVSFGGLCIQAQSMLFLSRAGVRTSLFLLGKVVQAGVAAVLCRLLLLLPAFARVLQGTETVSVPAGGLWVGTVTMGGAAAVLLVFVVLALVSVRASTRGSA